VISLQPSVGGASTEWNTELLAALYELVFSTPDREVAGVLVGIGAEQTGGLPLVRAAVPATQGFTVGQASQFTSQTWAQAHADMARYYQALEPVGWYVSRPGYGTGLMEADVVNHSRWFARPDQILLIVDSSTHHAAIYGWVAGRLTAVAHGAVTRRAGMRRRKRFPAAAVGLLIIIGITLGVICFIFAQTLGG
jgi:hypothetical protein